MSRATVVRSESTDVGSRDQARVASKVVQDCGLIE